jgi:hypothetical protein
VGVEARKRKSAKLFVLLFAYALQVLRAVRDRRGADTLWRSSAGLQRGGVDLVRRCGWASAAGPGWWWQGDCTVFGSVAFSVVTEGVAMPR